MEQYLINQIGKVLADDSGMRIVLEKEYTAALIGLEGFSHINILWWFSKTDNAEARSTLQEASPYKNAPEILGVFATRSPLRPNPIALSCAKVTHLDIENATIWVEYIDAEDGSPVLDIKPYTPSVDRVEAPESPYWCAHWPKNIETSGAFDWENEFTF